MTRLPTTFEYDGEEWHEGQKVSMVFEFFDGEKKRLEGILVVIHGEAAFVDTQFGTLVGHPNTLEDES